MNGSRDKKFALAINDEGATVVGDVTAGRDESENEGSENETENEREVHFSRV